MGIPESPSARGTCPSDEELAAFLDRMLPAEQRARITAHLADCESCYEIFAGAIHFQQDEEASDGRDEEPVEGKEGRIVPFPVKQESATRSRKSPWWAVAAAAILVLGGGLTAYRLLFPSEPKLDVADLKAKINPAQDFYRYAEYRGGSGQGSFADDAPKFMIGVLLTDIRLGRERGSIDAVRLDAVRRKLMNVSFADPDVLKRVQASVEKLNSGSPMAKEEVAKSLPAQEAAIEDSVASSAYNLGKWSEAGRLAAVTRTPGFFSRWSNKRFFAALLKDPLSKDEGVAEPLAEIKAIMDRGVNQADFDPLAQHFREIIRHYDI